MENAESLKNLVKEKYAAIAEQSTNENKSSCCGAGGCSTEVYSIMSDDYSNLEGYNKDADLGLGCGLPTEYAKLKSGDTVFDLGSGAGNDCFIARSIVGDTGKVVGIDMTEIMIAKARENADKLNFHNVEFRLGEIEKIPSGPDKADVIISNCVLNLVPDKAKAFAEIFRVLKSGGHFSISDVVLVGELPNALKNASEMYVGCVAGAMQKDEYLAIIKNAGFKNINILKEKIILIPDDILLTYLSDSEIKAMKESKAGIFSIAVYGEKESSCCDKEVCCK